MAEQQFVSQSARFFKDWDVYTLEMVGFQASGAATILLVDEYLVSVTMAITSDEPAAADQNNMGPQQ
jgi:hypothetical protein